MQGFCRLLEALRRLESAITAVAYTVVAALLVGDVLARELFGSSIWGAQKLAVLVTVFAAFCGFSLVTHANQQLRINLADPSLTTASEAVKKCLQELR